MKEFESPENVRVTVIARVSGHGKGYYLYIPKDIIEAYKILPGDKIEVQLSRHFRLKRKMEELEEGH